MNCGTWKGTAPKKEYAAVKCTAITRHMWGHAEPMNFTTKKDMYAWIRSKWEVSIVSKLNVITNNKTADTRDCSLCMQERVKLFAAFHEKNPKHKLMNNRTEFYTTCSCKTKFLRLSAVGLGGC